MAIELSTQLIHASIAAVLRDIDPNAEIFDNPTQQGTPYPAWYIVHRQPVERQRECGNRYMLVYGIDIWYMLQQNITRMYDQYTQVAERLQDVMEYLPIYGHPGVLIHTYENSWNLELNAMKYSITLRLRCSRNTVPEPKMQVIESLDVFLKTHFTIVRIRFVNPKPELDVEIPDILYAYVGVPIALPIINGIYKDGDGVRWEPKRWSIGGFGEEVEVTENTVTELEYEEVPVIEEPITPVYNGLCVVYANNRLPGLPQLDYMVINSVGDIVQGLIIKPPLYPEPSHYTIASCGDLYYGNSHYVIDNDQGYVFITTH